MYKSDKKWIKSDRWISWFPADPTDNLMLTFLFDQDYISYNLYIIYNNIYIVNCLTLSYYEGID